MNFNNYYYIAIILIKIVHQFYSLNETSQIMTQMCV